MHCNLYLKKGIVYIPTMGQMGRGFYRGIEPVAIASASDTESLRQALRETINRGNPAVVVPHRDEFPPSPILKYAGVSSWSAFVRNVMSWSIKTRGGSDIISSRLIQPDGSIVEDPDHVIRLPAGTPVEEVIERMIVIVQEAAKLSSMNDRER